MACQHTAVGCPQGGAGLLALRTITSTLVQTNSHQRTTDSGPWPQTLRHIIRSLSSVRSSHLAFMLSANLTPFSSLWYLASHFLQITIGLSSSVKLHLCDYSVSTLWQSPPFSDSGVREVCHPIPDFLLGLPDNRMPLALLEASSINSGSDRFVVSIPFVVPFIPPRPFSHTHQAA